MSGKHPLQGPLAPAAGSPTLVRYSLPRCGDNPLVFGKLVLVVAASMAV